MLSGVRSDKSPRERAFYVIASVLQPARDLLLSEERSIAAEQQIPRWAHRNPCDGNSFKMTTRFNDNLPQTAIHRDDKHFDDESSR
jgi:hypothetical protein